MSRLGQAMSLLLYLQLASGSPGSANPTFFNIGGVLSNNQSKAHFNNTIDVREPEGRLLFNYPVSCLCMFE